MNEVVNQLNRLLFGFSLLSAASTLFSQDVTPTPRFDFRFRVDGLLDDPMLGRIESVVAARLSALGLREVRTNRHCDRTIEVIAVGSVARRASEVQKQLRRPDSLKLALAASPDEIVEVFGADRHAVDRWMRSNKQVTTRFVGVPLYANPADPLKSRDHDPHQQPSLYYHRWFVPEGRGRVDHGVLVTAQPSLSASGDDVERWESWTAKTTGGVHFFVRESARRRLERFAETSGDLCLILNGRCVLKIGKSWGPMARSALAQSGRIGVTTSVVGFDVFDRAREFRRWLDAGGNRRVLTPIDAPLKRRRL